MNHTDREAIKTDESATRAYNLGWADAIRSYWKSQDAQARAERDELADRLSEANSRIQKLIELIEVLATPAKNQGTQL